MAYYSDITLAAVGVLQVDDASDIRTFIVDHLSSRRHSSHARYMTKLTVVNFRENHDRLTTSHLEPIAQRIKKIRVN